MHFIADDDIYGQNFSEFNNSSFVTSSKYKYISWEFSNEVLNLKKRFLVSVHKYGFHDK